jgi:hypothetical protein
MAASMAAASPQNFSPTQQNIRAGVVMLDSAIPVSGTSGSLAALDSLTHGLSVAPYAFYNLDRAYEVKPIGWNIYNPNAPGSITQDMVNRWTIINSAGVITGAIPTASNIGEPIGKHNADYWSVYLDQTSDQTLANYDILLVNPAFYAQLNTAESEKLLKFVDQGGLLWIDGSGVYNSQDIYDNFPLAFQVVQYTSGNTYANPLDPLLSTPNPISAGDLSNLHRYFLYGSAAVSTSSGDPGSYYTGLPFQFARYDTVTAVGATPTISVAHLGNGAIVLTPTGVSQILSRDKGQTLSTNYTSLQNVGYQAQAAVLDTDTIAAAKLVVNMLYELGDFAQPGGGSRKSGGSNVDVTAPVLTRWIAEGQTVYKTALNNISQNTPPVLYKGVYVASTGNCLTVIKAMPGTDLDGDGDPDDGLGSNGNTGTVSRDYSVGYPYDVIWVSAAMQTPISAPVCCEVADAANGLPKDQVMVVDGNGTLHVFGLFDKTSGGQLIGGTHALIGGNGYSGTYTPGQELYELQSDNAHLGAGTYAPPPSGVPNAPTVQEDLAFVADATDYTNPAGRLWVVDLSAGQYMQTSGVNWAVGGPSISGNPLPGYTAGPTVGYIPIQDNSGGYDRVIYTPGLFSQTYVPGFDSVWFSVKGESPTDVQLQGNTVQVTTRAGSVTGFSIYVPPSSNATPAQMNLAPKLTLLSSSGAPIAPGSALWNNIAPGAITQLAGNAGGFTFSVGNPTLYTQNVSGIRVDYTIDWTQGGAEQAVGSLAQLERGRLQLPTDLASPTTTVGEVIQGSIALTPSGTLCMAVSPQSNAPGSLYWFKENVGRGGFSMTGRFSLYNAFNMTLNEGAVSAWPSVVLNNDPLVGLLGSSFSSRLSAFSWAGSPVAEGNQVYALVNAMTTYNGMAVVPVTVVMAFAADPPTPSIQVQNLPVGFQFVQPDFERSSAAVQNVSSLSSGNFSYDSTTGVVQFPSLMTVNRGQITDSLSLSQPLIVRAGGLPDTVLDPSANGSTWTPLQWYSVFMGTSVSGPPLVTGNTLFLAGSSTVPNLLMNGTFGTTNGVVDAMDAVISTSNNSAEITTDSARPYLNQVNQIDTNGGFAPDPHIRMPQAQGVTSFSDYLTRLNQTVLGASSKAYGLVGGGQTVASWGNSGLYGLSRADFLICDEGRLVRVDSSGNALFATNANVNAGAGGTSFAANVTPLVRPTRAYSLDQNETLVVDTGGNRVVKLNKSGAEDRAISTFFTDPSFKPTSFQPNEPLALSAPRDAITYSGYVAQASNPLTGAQTLEYWVHYLVADSGHKRLVELIDRFEADSSGRIGPLVQLTMPDPNATPGISNGTAGSIPTRSVPQAGVLWWQSPSSVSGKNFDYNSVSRIFLNSVTNSGRYVYIAGIGSSQPSRSGVGLDNPQGAVINDSGTGNGGVVVFDPQSAAGIQVYSTWHRPDLTGTAFWDPATQKYDTGTAASAPDQDNLPLSNVSAVTARTVQGTNGYDIAQVMVSTTDGVFEFNVDPTQTSQDLGYPDWFINGAAYTGIRTNGLNAAQFRPSYARRLDSGEVLLVNSYTGQYQNGSSYSGEVLMLAGSNDGAAGTQNLGFGLPTIHFTLPSISGARDLVAPVFADRR